MTSDQDLRNAGGAAREFGDGVGGAALKLEGFLQLLQDTSGTLQSLISNPFATGYLLNRMGDSLKNKINTALQDTNRYTKQEREELQKLLNLGPGVVKLTGFMSGLALMTANTSREIYKAANEMGKFVNLSNLPGGTSDAFTSAKYMKIAGIERSMKYGAEFAQRWDQNFEQLASLLAGGGAGKGGTLDILTILQKNFNTLPSEAIRNAWSTYSSRGASPEVLRNFIMTTTRHANMVPEGVKAELLMAPTLQGASEMMGVFGGDYASNLNRSYLLTQFLMNNKTARFGDREVSNLVGSFAKFGQINNRIFQERFAGVDFTDDQGTGKGGVRYAAALSKYAASILKGKDKRSQLGVEEEATMDKFLNVTGLTWETAIALAKLEKAFENVSKSGGAIDSTIKKLDELQKGSGGEISNQKWVEQQLNAITKEVPFLHSLSTFLFQRMPASIADVTGMSPTGAEVASLALDATGGYLGYKAGKKLLNKYWHGGKLGSATLLQQEDDIFFDQLRKETSTTEGSILKSVGKSTTVAEERAAMRAAKVKNFFKRGGKGGTIAGMTAGIVALDMLLNSTDVSAKDRMAEAVAEVGLAATPLRYLAPDSDLGADETAKLKVIKNAYREELYRKGLATRANIDPTARALLRGNRITKEDASVTSKALEQVGRGVVDNIDKVAPAVRSSKEKNEVSGTINVVISNSLGNVIGQGEVPLTKDGQGQSVPIHVFLGAITNSVSF